MNKKSNETEFNKYLKEQLHVVQVFEYINGSDLYKIVYSDMEKNGGYIKFHRLEIYINILKTVCEGLKLLHDNEIYHCDMKPENIVIESLTMRPYIIDLDFATATSYPRLKRGTNRYLAPEYIQAFRGHRDIGPLSKTGPSFDMWAIGAILWTILYGTTENFLLTEYTETDLKSAAIINPHIQALCSVSLYQNFLTRRIPPLKHTSNDFSNSRIDSKLKEDLLLSMRDLLCKLLRFDPSERLTANETVKYLSRLSI